MVNEKDTSAECCGRTFIADPMGGRLWFSPLGHLDFIDLPAFADIRALRPNGDLLVIETTRGTFELQNVAGSPDLDWRLVLVRR